MWIPDLMELEYLKEETSESFYSLYMWGLWDNGHLQVKKEPLPKTNLVRTLILTFSEASRPVRKLISMFKLWTLWSFVIVPPGSSVQILVPRSGCYCKIYLTMWKWLWTWVMAINWKGFKVYRGKSLDFSEGGVVRYW